ncbi:MAG: hypothetical protein J6U68_00970 [Clostridia bacterium]|nr:hypothetical protein [Clostridia bacterium]
MRGCQKKVIYIKNTGSDCFEEAYFVVKDEAYGISSERDFLSEANRIVDEISGSGIRKRDKTGSLMKWAVVFVGVCSLLIGIVSILLLNFK